MDVTEEKLFLHLEFFEALDLAGNKQQSRAVLSLSTKQLQAGLVKQVGARNFAVLIAVASYLNKENLAFPSIEKITEITGLSAPTVVKSITELLDVRVGGQPIIVKKKVRTAAGNQKNIYHFVGAEVEAEDSSESCNTDAMTAKEIIVYFCEQYEEVFSVPYTVSWGREMQQVKTKLVGKYSNEQLKQIIEIAVGEYSKRWANTRYKLPTLGQLCSWLANAAAGILVEKEQQEKRIAERAAYAEKASTIDPAAMLDM